MLDTIAYKQQLHPRLMEPALHNMHNSILFLSGALEYAVSPQTDTVVVDKISSSPLLLDTSISSPIGWAWGGSSSRSHVASHVVSVLPAPAGQTRPI